MNLSKKTMTYLRSIYRTEEASVVLMPSMRRQAQELCNNNLAILIPISRGGCHVALTQSGINLCDDEEVTDVG